MAKKTEMEMEQWEQIVNKVRKDFKESCVNPPPRETFSMFTCVVMEKFIGELEKDKCKPKEIAERLAADVQCALLEYYSKNKKRGQQVLKAFIKLANSHALYEPVRWKENA